MPKHRRFCNHPLWFALISMLCLPFPVSADPTDESLRTRSALERIVDEIKADLDDRLGYSLQLPVEVDEGRYNIEDFFGENAPPHIRGREQEAIATYRARGYEPYMRTFPAEILEDPAAPGRPVWSVIGDGERVPSDAYCVIIASTAFETEWGEQLQRRGLAHELFHCYQIAWVGPEAFWNLPGWIMEGTAEWSARVLNSGIGSEMMWEEYLTRSRSLFERDYDAFPFFAHYESLRHDLYDVVRALIKAPDAAFDQLANRGGDEFLRTWPTGVIRQPALGPHWDIREPGITPDRRSSTYTFVPDEEPLTETLSAGEQLHLWINWPAGKVLNMIAHGYGAVSWGATGGSSSLRESPISRSLVDSYCREGECLCGDRSANGVVTVPDGTAIIALTATSMPANLTLYATEPLCCEEVTGPLHDSCLWGTWLMTDVSAERAYFGGPSRTGQLTQEGEIRVTFGETGELLKRYRKRFSYVRLSKTDIPRVITQSVVDWTGSVAACVSNQSFLVGPKYLIATGIQNHASVSRQGSSQRRRLPPNQWPIGARTRAIYNCDGDRMEIDQFTFTRESIRVDGD